MYITVPTPKKMTKRLALIAIVSSFLLISSASLAQEKTTPKPSSKTASASAAIDDKKVKELKEKLATQVAQLRESQKRGFLGEVASSSKTSFTLVTLTGEIRIRYTEDTKFFKLTSKGRTEAKSDELKNGLTAASIGLFDEENKQLNAKAVILQGTPLIIKTGEITEINKTDAVVTVKDANGQNLTIDYEKTTVADEVNSSKKVARSGLSRFATGDQILAWVVTSDEDSKKFSARRLVRIPKELFTKSTEKTDAPKASASPEATPKSSPKSSPAASSKTSAKATPKPSPTASPKS